MTEKKHFFEQMGEYYVSRQCAGKAFSDIVDDHNSSDQPRDLLNSCCLAEPAVTCHYRNKPSKIPCRDSPSLGTDGTSFW
jgi:hypothetical protein